MVVVVLGGDAESLGWIGDPCDEEDRELFYAATTITIGDGSTASFWHSPWIDGQKPKNIALGIFVLSKHTSSCTPKVFPKNEWVRHINT